MNYNDEAIRVLIMLRKRNADQAFTLIELSVVLVIIGLIVGGVLVGRDLIAAAEIRAQISQVEKLQQAVNTFLVKYAYLPGDIPNPYALNFGLPQPTPGGEPLRATADGDGAIKGNGSYPYDAAQVGQEHTLFWQDLFAAKLIEFNPRILITINAGDSMGNILPPARIGRNNFIYAWSGGYGNIYPNTARNGINYFGLQYFRDPVSGAAAYSCFDGGDVGLKVSEAYAIERKIDDGKPQTGNIIAFYVYCDSGGQPLVRYSGGRGNGVGPSDTSASAASTSSCMDNGGVSGEQQYSIGQNNGGGLNCALSFKFH